MKKLHLTWAVFFILILSGLPSFASNLLDPANGAQITAINKELNNTNWAAANLTDLSLTTRWLSNRQTNNINYIFNSNKDSACFNRFDLVNYGTNDRSVQNFMLFRTLDGSLSADIGSNGWIPIPADINPVGPINHNSWGQGSRLTSVNSQLNNTNWAGVNINDGDINSFWLSSKANNQLVFNFDTNWDGVADNAINIKQIKIYNYGSNRSVKLFQLETSTDGINWKKIEVPGSNAGDPDFNYALIWHGASLSAIDRQLNTSNWAANNIHDGDLNTRWLSNKGNNTLDFVFDVDFDGTSGADGDSDDLFTLEKFTLYNYGNNDRSVRQFQIEVKTLSQPAWTKLKVPGTAPGIADYNFLLTSQGGILKYINSQLNNTNWAAKNIHDGDPNTRWLSNKGNNVLDFAFDVDLDGTTGADGDTDDLFTMDKFFLRNYGSNDRSINQFQVEVKTSANNTWEKLPVPGSAAGQPDYNFALKDNGGQLDFIDSQLNSTNWAAKNIHDGDLNTRWLSNKPINTLEYSFDTDFDGSSGNGINLDKISLLNYGNDDRSIQTFEIDIKVNNGSWQTITAPGGGTVFNPAMNGNLQDWNIGPFTNVTQVRLRTLTNYGDPNYTGASEIIFSGVSVGPSYTFNAAMNGDGETFTLSSPVNNITNVRLRSINNHGDSLYTGASEFMVLGPSISESYTFTAAMNSTGETFTLPTADQPVDVTAVRFRTINNYGNSLYTGASELLLSGTAISAGHTFTIPQGVGPHTITLENDDIVSSATSVRLITIQNYGNSDYTGMRELELLGDPVGPDYIFKADMNGNLQSFNFTPSLGRVFRFHSLSNHGDPSYIGATELALNESNGCIISEWRMDESSWSGLSNEVLDSSGNGYNGIARNNVTTADGTDPQVNGGICRVGSFNDNGYVELPTFPNLTESFTITGWFNTFDNTEPGQRIFADDETSTGGYALSVGDPGKGRIRFYHRSFNPVSLDTSPYLIANNQWYFAAASFTLLTNNKAQKDLYLFDSSGNLLEHKSELVNGSLAVSPGLASLGGEVNGAESWNRFKGYVDEVKVFKGVLAQADLQTIVDFERIGKNWDGSSRSCSGSTALDHLEIIHDGQGITCSPETITIKACINPDCSSLYTADVDISLLPVGSSDFWTGNATISNGIGIYKFSHTVSGTVNLGIASSNPVAVNGVTCNISGVNDCSMVFSDAGFVFSINNQNACQNSADIEIRAVKKSDTSVSCVPAFSGNRSVHFSTGYNNPASGNKKVAITPYGGSTEFNPDTNPVVINFTPGQNFFKARYDDAGRITLTADYSDSTGLTLSGSKSFIVIPDALSVLAKLPGSGGAVLNAVTASALPIRKAANDIFEVEVKAECIEDNGNKKTVNNFIADVQLSGENAGPLPGFLGALGGNISRNDFTQTGNIYDKLVFDDINYSESGYFTLRASVNNYLGTGINLTGTQLTGRFVPDHFSLITPYSAGTALDWGGSFVYMKQPKIKVEYTLEAQNGNNIITRNYNGSFATAGVSGVAENNNDGIELSSRLSNLSSTWLNGQMSFSNDGLLFNRISTPDGHFSNLKIGLLVIDNEAGTDILLHDLDMNPQTSSSCTALNNCTAKSLGTLDVRYGRLVINNAYGAVELPLAVDLGTEYFDSTTGQFKRNYDDSYTSFNVSTGINWSSTVFSGITGSDITATGSGSLSQGTGSFSFHKPGQTLSGPGKEGYIDYQYVTDDWLKYDWKGTGDENPSARASFGIYNRSKHLIYSRELY